jgi:hypothetical protein
MLSLSMMASDGGREENHFAADFATSFDGAGSAGGVSWGGESGEEEDYEEE